MDEETRQLCPFPGMDPYLEAPDIWSDFQHALAAAIGANLNTSLPVSYYARLQKRPEMRVHTEPLQHHFVEVRDAERGHRLVTLIEIVSPSNKRPGPDRRSYEAKQKEVPESDANLIELDLLRDGRRVLPYLDLVEAVKRLNPDYLVLLNRSALRDGSWMDYTLYPVGLRDPLPCIPVPLSGDDPDVLLDLQVAFNRVYQEGPYRRMIDYSAAPPPPLDKKDAAWADERLRSAGLR